MRGRGGGKLRGDLGHAPLLHETLQGGIVRRGSLEKAPAEAVYEQENHGVVAPGQAGQNLWCEAGLALAGQQAQQRGG